LLLNILLQGQMLNIKRKISNNTYLKLYKQNIFGTIQRHQTGHHCHHFKDLSKDAHFI